VNVVVMQPYLFPYLGYFKLLEVADVFIFLDNVQYLRRGWMNRNYLVVEGVRKLVTLPVKKSPRDTLFKDIFIDSERYNVFRQNVMKCLAQHENYNHSRAELDILFPKDLKFKMLSEYAEATVKHFAYYLDKKVYFYRASELLDDSTSRNMSASQRILSLCRKVGAKRYINLVGGASLYEEKEFSEAGIQLSFIDVEVSPEFLIEGGAMSVLDSFIRFSKQDLINELKRYTVVKAE